MFNHGHYLFFLTASCFPITRHCHQLCPSKKGGWKDDFVRWEQLWNIESARVILCAAYAQDIADMSPEDLFRRGLIDPKNVFIKDEPHAAKKVRTSRWRLIWIQSYVDSTIQRMLHGQQNKVDVLSYIAGLSSGLLVRMGHVSLS